MRYAEHRSKLEVAAVLVVALAIADGIRSFYSPPLQTHAAIVAFMGVISVYGALKLRGEDDFVEEFSGAFNAIGETADRMVLAVALMTMLLLQILVAAEVLSDDAAHELTHLFDFGIVTIGAFDIAMYLISIWMLAPLLGLVGKALRSTLQGVGA